MQCRKVALVRKALNEDGERRDGRRVLRARDGPSELAVRRASAKATKRKEGTHLRRGVTDLGELGGEEEDCAGRRVSRTADERTSSSAPRRAATWLGQGAERGD